ncbi:uncharacterized protein LY79DRAFT_525346 [Colletotrichum navitas]|uniref:Uncharacterized protein n=1 Tax=Colletotrichum navitas TaxID=681940 RepID=A0AAD8UYE0_9PEZI|nr:uncharacterized protein LY79DRAFT_525346 [Colletotrichum navitas]KAK1573671.1 hypothetical protein LY79DRAFT_525346 [Colletotrichum navitas]
MSAIRSSSSALLLLGGVATLPGAATVRSRFPQRSPSSDSADAELGYMQQPLGPVSSSSTRTAAPTAATQKPAPRSSAASATAAQVVTMATIRTRPQAWYESDAGYRSKSAREMVAVILGRNQKYSSL